MTKLIFGIFAHPDDEAFGPAGTLLLEKDAGTQIHLISLTSGDAGENPHQVANLGEERLKEWHTAGERLGATSMLHLGYKDGLLNNQAMITITKQLLSHLHTILQASDATEVEFLTFDTNGLTGHIDHIVATRAACAAFYKLKEEDSRLTRMRLFCLPHKQYPTISTSWIFQDAGPTQVDEVVDARAIRDRIIHVMDAHVSQQKDRDFHLATLGDDLGLDHFLVKD